MLAPIQTNILSNVTANTVAVVPEVLDFHHIHLQVAATSAATSGATIKVLGSFSETRPDFAAAVSLTNQYFPISIKNLDTVANINGATGITLGASATLVQGYMVNTDQLKWIAVQVSGVTGTVNISVRLVAGDHI
jgi:hypothetical protein